MKNRDAQLAERIFVASIIVFFVAILLYSLVLPKIKISRTNKPLIEFSIAENKVLLNNTPRCEGRIKIVDAQCINKMLRVVIKNAGNSSLIPEFLIIARGNNITIYHAFSDDSLLLSNRIIKHEFQIRPVEIKSVSVINIKCPDINDTKKVSLKCFNL